MVRSKNMSLGIVECPNCRMRVLPMEDGTCPSCQAHLSSRHGPIMQATSRVEPNRYSQPVSRQTRIPNTARASRHSGPEKALAFVQDYLKRFFGLTKPVYNELSAYLTALTCVVLFFSHPDFRQYLFSALDNTTGEGGPIPFLVLGSFAIMGFALSIFHVFTDRTKSSFEKYCMGAFAIGANALASIEGGIETIRSGGSILVLFPIWNIIIGIVMIFQIRYNKFEVTDENASLLEVSWASLALLIVFAITNLALHVSWAMTFSICMFYSSSAFLLISWIVKHSTLRLPNTGSRRQRLRR